jgi:hypothetical protein
LPNDVPQRVQVNSCSSPEGSTSKSFSRTGWETRHLGQYSSLAVKVPNCCDMRLNFHHVQQNIKQHFGGVLVRIDAVQNVFSVKGQDRFAFAIVGLQTSPNNIHVRIVQAVFFQSPALEAFDKLIDMGAAKIKNRLDIYRIDKHLSLVDIARNPVQDQGVRLGAKAAGFGGTLNKVTPQINRGLIRDQFPAAGIFQKHLANTAVSLQASEDVPASAMKKVGDRADDFALRPLAYARRAEQ